MSEYVIPAVLLRVLSEYKFVGHTLWRMADGKDHVRVELTFHKTLPTLPVYWWWWTSSSCGLARPRQPTAARRPPPPTTRPTPPERRQPPSLEKETSPPSTQTLPDTTRSTITHDRTQKTAIIEPAPIITRPTTPPPTPESPPKKKSRISSPDKVNIEPTKEYNYFEFKNPDWYPLEEKYGIQEIRGCKFTDFSCFIFKAQRKYRPN